MMARIRLQEGDLAAVEADALVVDACSDLSPRTPSSARLRERGGQSVEQECRRARGGEPGGAFLTGAGALGCRSLIHAVLAAPGEPVCEPELRSALRRAFDLAGAGGLRTLALGALGSGPSGLPLQRCAEVLLEEARAAAGPPAGPDEIRFVLEGEPEFRLFEQVSDAERVRASLALLRRGQR